MKARNHRVLFAVAASIGLVACASQPRYEASESPVVIPAVAVEVTNRNWMDIVVYAVTSTQLVKLGSVTTGAQERFELPRSVNILGGDLYLEARPIGSRQIFRSQPMMVAPGDRVIWNVENAEGLSNFSIVNAN